MLEDNSGMGFIVTPGTPIGRNRGVVTAIEPRRIVVEEKLIDYYGHEQTQRVFLEMPKDEEAQRDDQG
jgi:Tfp pilus assembly protein PilP